MKTESTVEEIKSPTETGLFLSGLFKKFEQAGIKYCVMRGYQGLPQSISHDIDLQVDKHKHGEYLLALDQTAQDMGWIILRRRFRFGRRFNSLIRLTEEQIEKVPIDAEFITHWKSIQYISNSAVLAARKLHNGLWVASSGSEAAISLFKEYLQFGKVKDLGDGLHKRRIAMLADSDPDTFIAAVEPYLGIELSKFALACAQHEDWDTLEKNVGLVRRTLILRALKREPVGQLVNWFRFLWGHISDKIFKPSGMFVCLIGPDGSGKTTVSQAIQRDMKDAFSDVLYYHGHVGILPELKVFYNIAAGILGRPKKMTEENKKMPAGETDIVVGRLKAVAYMFYYALDYFLAHFLIRKAKGQGKLVLFDRYFYDYFIQGMHRKIPEWLFWFVYLFMPKPDLVIWLRADPVAIYKRKPELTVEQIKWQSDRCQCLAGRLSSVATIKADEGVAQAVKGVYEAIVGKMTNTLRKGDNKFSGK
ncbi:MAG: hypothetical protein WAV13_08300 [Thermodesulfovibrionales bacterium]